MKVGVYQSPGFPRKYERSCIRSICTILVERKEKRFIFLPPMTKKRWTIRFGKIGPRRRIFVLWATGWTRTKTLETKRINLRIDGSTITTPVKETDLVRSNFHVFGYPERFHRLKTFKLRERECEFECRVLMFLFKICSSTKSQPVTVLNENV